MLLRSWLGHPSTRAMLPPSCYVTTAAPGAQEDAVPEQRGSLQDRGRHARATRAVRRQHPEHRRRSYHSATILVDTRAQDLKSRPPEKTADGQRAHGARGRTRDPASSQLASPAPRGWECRLVRPLWETGRLLKKFGRIARWPSGPHARRAPKSVESRDSNTCHPSSYKLCARQARDGSGPGDSWQVEASRGGQDILSPPRPGVEAPSASAAAFREEASKE